MRKSRRSKRVESNSLVFSSSSTFQTINISDLEKKAQEVINFKLAKEKKEKELQEIKNKAEAFRLMTNPSWKEQRELLNQQISADEDKIAEEELLEEWRDLAIESFVTHYRNKSKNRLIKENNRRFIITVKVEEDESEYLKLKKQIESDFKDYHIAKTLVDMNDSYIAEVFRNELNANLKNYREAMKSLTKTQQNKLNTIIIKNLS